MERELPTISSPGFTIPAWRAEETSSEHPVALMGAPDRCFFRMLYGQGLRRESFGEPSGKALEFASDLQYRFVKSADKL